MASTGDDDADFESALSSPWVGTNHDGDEDDAENLVELSQPGKMESILGSDSATSEADEDPERENRFKGPASTWRSYTEAERGLIKSLDQERAGDLSMHLFNAHALKARVRDPEAHATAKPYHSKKRWIRRNEDGSLPWYPKDSWTAWPMRPEDVPRMSEKFGVDLLRDKESGTTYRKAESWRPGAEMEEEVFAIMLRQAKENFRERRWHGDADSSTDVAAKVKREQMAPNDDRAGDNASSEDGSTDSSTDNQHTTLALLDDDDEAFELLEPMVRHVMSKLDALLVGLYKSRQGRSQPPQDQARSRSRNKPSRSRSRSCKLPAEPAELSEEDEEEEPPQTPKKRKREQKLNPRDWSEVLATASMTGWDAEVIRRTAQRCADLFGETFDTAGAFQNADSLAPEPEAEQEEDLVAEDKRWVCCPVGSCKRKQEPFEQLWRWREHLKRVHRFDNAEITKAEEKLERPGK